MAIVPGQPFHIWLTGVGPNGEDETYQVSNPLMTVHNYILGTPYLDLHGKGLVQNVLTGEQCVPIFHKRNWSGSDVYRVECDLKDNKGKTAFKIRGKFSEQIYLYDCRGDSEKVEFVY